MNNFHSDDFLIIDSAYFITKRGDSVRSVMSEKFASIVVRNAGIIDKLGKVTTGELPW